MARNSTGTKESKHDGTAAELELLLGHRFQRPELLTLALTHRSFVYDGLGIAGGADAADPSQDNEQLEFIGDAALGLLVAEALYLRFPHSREGELTRLRASLVGRKYLGEVGTRLELGRWLRLGHTAETNEGRRNTALFANTVEALIAALYLDGGLPAARRFVETHLLADALPGMAGSIAAGEDVNGATGDFKSALQELAQGAALGRPRYVVLEESGPDHRRRFRIEVRLDGAGESRGSLAEAEASTKKEAQQQAARLALRKLQTQGVAS